MIVSLWECSTAVAVLGVCGSGWISVSRIDRWWRCCCLTHPHPRRRPAVKLPPRQGAALPLSTRQWISLEFHKGFHKDRKYFLSSVPASEGSYLYIWFVLLDNSPLTAVAFNFIQQSKNFMMGGGEGGTIFTITSHGNNHKVCLNAERAEYHNEVNIACCPAPLSKQSLKPVHKIRTSGDWKDS